MTRFELATPCSRSRIVRCDLCALTYQRGRHPGTFLRGRAEEVFAKTHNWQHDHIGVAREATQKKPHSQEVICRAKGSMGFWEVEDEEVSSVG